MHQSMRLTVLVDAGSQALHGDITQSNRERTLKKFRDGKLLVLVATDVAARGLDIPAVDLVVHYELPTVRGPPRVAAAGRALATRASPQRRTQVVRPAPGGVGCGGACCLMWCNAGQWSPSSLWITGSILF